jgi:two-component system sensor histidine kinase UhpB
MIHSGPARPPEWGAPEASPHDELALLHAQEWERKWLAEQIQDEPLQTLAQVSRLLQVATEPGEPSSRVRESAREALRLTERVSEALRSLARQLRPSILDDFGIVRALRALTSEFGLRNGMSARFALVGRPHALGDDQELTCYRVAQEALRLVEERGRAVEVEVRLIMGTRGVRMLVVDASQPGVPPTQNSATVVELRALRHRAAMLGGSLRVRRHRSGEILRLHLPTQRLPEPRADPGPVETPGWGRR